MNRHTLLSAMVVACLTLGTCTFFVLLAEWLEWRQLMRREKENSPTNFDLNN